MSRAQVEQLRQTLEAVVHIRRRTRSAIGGLWYPTVVFGGFILASAPLAFVWGDAAFAWYWPFAAALGIALTVRYFHRREQALGVGSRGWPFLLTGVAISAACAFLGAGGQGMGAVGAVGPYLVVSAGNLVFAGLGRSRTLALLGLGTGAAALMLSGLLDPTDVIWLLPLLYGAVTVAAGTMIRRTGRWA
jgi:hypothetical protein